MLNLRTSGTLWMPQAISDLAARVDALFYFIYYASIITFVGLIVVTVYFLVKYKSKRDEDIPKNQITHSTKLEVIWSVIPFILLGIIFVWSYRDYIQFSVAPPNSQEIMVTGYQWNWLFEYPNGTKLLNELKVPVGTPIKLIMSSTDVLHSLYIPNLRVKRDVIPNRYTTIWFKADTQGQFRIFCTEYCGDAHSNMLATLDVLSQEAYADWVENGDAQASDMPLDELGKELYSKKGCNACHSVDGGTAIGPTWKGLYGTKRSLVGMAPETADENYLRESIVYPATKISTGYQNVMPSYAGLLTDREIDALIAYIKTLK